MTLPDNPFKVPEKSPQSNEGEQPQNQQPQNQQPQNQQSNSNPFALNPEESKLFKKDEAGNQNVATQNTTNQTGTTQVPSTENVAANEQPKPNLEGGVSMQNQNNSFSSPPPNMTPPPNFGGQPPQQGFGGGQPPQQGGFNPQPQPQQGGFNPQPQQGGFGGSQPPQQGGFGGGQPPQQGFGGSGNFPQQASFGSGGGGGGDSKYNIVDLYWFVNRKLFAGQQLSQNEAALVTIGFNASFGNLRLALHSMKEGAITPTSIVMENCPRVAICNLHPETAVQLLASKGNQQPVQLMERVIKAGNWTPNTTQIVWSTNITIQSQDQQGNVHTFTFLDDQIKAFESALGFMIDGNAWVAALMSVITRNS